MTSKSNAFPSLLIKQHETIPQGSFAEAQSMYLNPDRIRVDALATLLKEKSAGIVAHFYMDAELQGVLAAAKEDYPFIRISDSLAMADAAIEMAQAGCKNIVVLGVDFMSENVRAMLDASGFEQIEVYRVATEEIGCSLADSADSDKYFEWLASAEGSENLHVVYINTSLLSKARAHATMPTITCTSSNVVQTILQASAQNPELSIYFGPDTYMGENLRRMLERYLELPDEMIRRLHRDHSQESIKALLDRFHYYKDGHCIVHHMFGAEVVAIAKASYSDAFVTAHLEVPGEMFALGLSAQEDGRGVVGSTSNILEFIHKKTEECLDLGLQEIQFILGTESGMITSVVDSVQKVLRSAGSNLGVRIVFPVASDAIMQADDSLGVVPGAAAGEGCTTAGGCASCPYMKMNTLDRTLELVKGMGRVSLQAFEPRKYTEQIGGKSAADVGGQPILFMRQFQKSGRIPDQLA